MNIENKITRLLPSLAAGAVLAFGAAACGGDDEGSGGSSSAASGGGTLSGEIAGAGASSQEAAMAAWIAGFQEANPEVTISYDPIGSGGGREQFVAGGSTLFGGTDAAFEDEELAGAQERCGGANNFVEVPVYVSPIAVIYNVEGVDSLQLSPDTLAKVFKGEITEWSDPAIAGENEGVELPDERITVVHRSDESGTTENLQEYLSAVAGDVRDFEVSGDWPVEGQEAADGTSGVVDAVTNGANTIGYADASQAADLGQAKIQVGDSYVEPSPEAAARILEASEKASGGGQNVVTYEVARDTEEAGTYPIVLVSYAMACTQYEDAAQGKIVGGFLKYVASEEGQQAAAENAGSAPLSEAVRSEIEPIVAKIGAGTQ